METQVFVNVRLAVFIFGCECLAFEVPGGVTVDDAICMAQQAYAQTKGWA